MYAKAQMFLPRTANDSDLSDFVASDLSAGEAAIVSLQGTKLAGFITPADATESASDLSYITGNIHTKFQVMWRKYNTSDVIQCTPELSFAELVEAKKLTGAGGTAQVTTLTLTVPGTQAIGDTYSLTIVDTTPGTAKLDKFTYEVVNVTGADYTAETLGDAFRTLIAADSSRNKVVGSGTTTLILTGATTENHFRVAYEGDAPATIVYTTDLLPGTLLKSQVQQMEKDMKSHGEGITNTLWFPKDWTSEVSDVAARFNNMGVFRFNLNRPAKHGMNATNYEDYTLYVAEAADINIVDGLIAAWNITK